MDYASFWQRFGALWIDTLLVVPPLAVLGVWLESLSKGGAIASAVFTAMLALGYQICCHARWGKTVGKRVMGIRVVRIDCEPIGWREAWLRSGVDIFFAVLEIVGSIIALSAISNADYSAVDWLQRSESLRPEWLVGLPAAQGLWTWSEVITMLFNADRRALHDFIAGTLVLRESSWALQRT